jgi:hypothetical protein
MRDYAEGEFDLFGDALERQQCVFERARFGIGGQRIESLLSLGEQLVERGLDVGRLDPVERDAELDGAEGIGGGHGQTLSV